MSGYGQAPPAFNLIEAGRGFAWRRSPLLRLVSIDSAGALPAASTGASCQTSPGTFTTGTRGGPAFPSTPARSGADNKTMAANTAVRTAGVPLAGKELIAPSTSRNRSR